MRKTMRPPALLAESQAMRHENTLPRCILPEGVGAKRPITVDSATGSTSLGLYATLCILWLLMPPVSYTVRLVTGTI